MQTTTTRRITVLNLTAALPGTHPRWWERRLPKLRELGLLRRVGRYHFGDFNVIAAAVMAGALDRTATEVRCEAL